MEWEVRTYGLCLVRREAHVVHRSLVPGKFVQQLLGVGFPDTRAAVCTTSANFVAFGGPGCANQGFLDSGGGALIAVTVLDRVEVEGGRVGYVLIRRLDGENARMSQVRTVLSMEFERRD